VGLDPVRTTADSGLMVACFAEDPRLGFSVSAKRRATVALSRQSLRHSIPFRLLAGAGL
jgi:hypothetical protein